jgi:hypothetical protein
MAIDMDLLKVETFNAIVNQNNQIVFFECVQGYLCQELSLQRGGRRMHFRSRYFQSIE